MDTNTFIAQLRDVRGNLSEAVRSANRFELKLTGPRPAEGKNQQAPSNESVGSILSDINALSLQLVKMLEHQHEIVGDFTPTQLECANPNSRFA